MKGAKLSMYAFSVYLVVIGVALAVFPNDLLSIVGLPETDEIWISILGVVAIVLALYYFDSARNNTRSFFAASLLGRGFFVTVLVVVWLAGQPWQLLIFAGVELAAAIWTYTAMRAEAAR